MEPEDIEQLRQRFDAELAERIERYGWGPLAGRQMSKQAEAELDALLALQKRQAEKAMIAEVDANGDVLPTWQKLGMTWQSIDGDTVQEDEVEDWCQAEIERHTCIWCGGVQPTLEALEAHEEECQ